IYTDSAGSEPHVPKTQPLFYMWSKRVERLGAEPADARRGIVTGQRGQVDAAYRIDQPGSLMKLLDRTAGRQGCRTAFGRRTVYRVPFEHPGGKRHSGIARVAGFRAGAN